MRKRIVSLVLAVVMCFGLAVPVMAQANGDTRELTVTVRIYSWNPDTGEEGEMDVDFTITLTGIISETTEYFDVFDYWDYELGDVFRAQAYPFFWLAPGAEFTILNPTDIAITVGFAGLRWGGDFVTANPLGDPLMPGVNTFTAGNFVWFDYPEPGSQTTWADIRHIRNYEAVYRFGGIAFGVGGTAGQPTPEAPAADLSTASDWAHKGITRAIAEGLVPPALQGNYTQAATRAEFTALAVALYENVAAQK